MIGELMPVGQGELSQTEDENTLAVFFKEMDPGDIETVTGERGQRIELTRQRLVGQDSCRYTHILTAEPQEKRENNPTVYIFDGVIGSSWWAEKIAERGVEEFGIWIDPFWTKGRLCCRLAQDYKTQHIKIEGLDYTRYSIQDYAARIGKQIEADSSKRKVAVGYSVGGVALLGYIASLFTEYQSGEVRLKQGEPGCQLAEAIIVDSPLGYSQASQDTLQSFREIWKDKSGAWCSRPPITAQLVTGNSYMQTLYRRLKLAQENFDNFPKLNYLACDIGDEYAIGPGGYAKLEELNEMSSPSKSKGISLGEMAIQWGAVGGGGMSNVEAALGLCVDKNGKPIHENREHLLAGRVLVRRATHFDILLHPEVIEIIIDMVGKRKEEFASVDAERLINNKGIPQHYCVVDVDLFPTSESAKRTLIRLLRFITWQKKFEQRLWRLLLENNRNGENGEDTARIYLIARLIRALRLACEQIERIKRINRKAHSSFSQG